MADNDSDFSDDEGDEQPIITHKAAPVPTATSVPAAAAAPQPIVPVSSPHLLIAIPCHVTPPMLSSSLPGCGLALIYDPSGALPFTITLYDARKNHLIHTPISYLASPTDLCRHNAPLSYTSLTSTTATICDLNMRTYNLMLVRPEDGMRMSAMLGVAQCITQGKTKDERYVQARFDLVRGTGHTCRPGSHANLTLRFWLIDIASSTSSSILTAITSPSFTSLATFHPSFDITQTSTSTLSTYDVDVDVESDENVIMPNTLGQIVHKMKEGGTRLCVFPSTSPVAQSILASQNAASRAHHGALLMIHITAVTVSKKGKKEKKDTKKDKSSKKAVSFDAEKSTTKAVPSTSSSSSSSTSSISHLLLTDDSLQHLITSLRTLAIDMNALSATQNAIFKHLCSGLYDDLRTDLDLIAPIEPVREDGEDEAVYVQRMDEWKQAVEIYQQKHPDVEKHLTALQSRLRGLFTEYAEKNNMDHKGTTSHVSTAWKQFLSTIQPLFEAGGLLTRDSMTAIRAACDAPHVDVGMEQSLRVEKEKNDQLTKQVQELTNKQTAFTTERTSMEETIAKLTKERDELQKKTAMLTVFESGLVDMRKMLESEMEEKNKYQKQFQQLNQLQKTLKVTWIPEKSVNECMACHAKFGGMFGKSKQFCRCCGRIFCKECTTRTLELPELGYGRERVRVCQSCYEWKIKIAGERANKQGDDGEEEQD